MSDNIKIIVKNSRVGYDYFVEEKCEAGIALVGTEVKSLRLGKAKLADSFVMIDDHFEAWLYNLSIAHYTHGNINNHDENRKRKLLLNQSELIDLHKKMQLKGLSLIPTMIYFKKSMVKCEIALVRGKKLYDKRESAAKKDVERKLRQGQYE